MRTRQNKARYVDQLVAAFTSELQAKDEPISKDIAKYEQILNETWSHCDDLKTASLEIHGTKVHLAWLRGLVDKQAMQFGILERLTAPLKYSIEHMPDMTAPQIIELHLAAAPVQHCTTMNEVYEQMSAGCVVIYCDGEDTVLGIDLNNMPGKAIESSQSEPVIEGPQEAFTESLDVNIAMIRKRFRNPRFKAEASPIGDMTKTSVCIMYVEGITKPEIISEVRQRVSRIEIDAILDINYIREMIRDEPWSPFPTTESTERPDKVIAALLQGRVAIMSYGATHVLLLPATFVQFLISPEDMYSHFFIATPMRVLRHIMFWASVLLPGLYVSLLSYQQDLIPTPLLISLVGQHEGIPFPTVVEAFLMQFFFEALREAGQRLPRAVGQSVSIVGGLVIGDAAVNAGLVSPGMVIVVAATGISSFTIASYSLVNTSRVVQFAFLASAGLLGLYGMVVFGIIVVTHLVSIRSFGVPYMSPFAPLNLSDMKDSIYRVPWWMMRQRPTIFAKGNTVRNRTPQPGPQPNE